VALAASLAGLGNDFAYDDLYLIRDNLRIHDLANWRAIVGSSYWPLPHPQDLYRPLSSLLLAVQYALGGGAPGVFRIVSYLLYAGVAIAVLRLATRFLPRPIALGAALLFAAHPLHVEAVALGAGQSELLVALVAVVMVTRYLDRRRTESFGRRDWAVLGALYLAAGLSKEHGLLLPALLIAVELTLVPGPWGSRVRRLWGGYALLGGIGVLVLLLRRAALGGAIAGTYTTEALQGLTMAGRALTMLKVVPEWVRLLLWPAHLRSDYSPQEMVASIRFGAAEALGAALLVAGAVAAWLARRRAPAMTFGLAWCGLSLLPVSNVLFPTGILLAERTLFLPSVGLLLAGGGLVAALWRHEDTMPARWVVGLGALVLAGVLRSVERQRVWRNEAFLAARSVQDAPRSFRTQRAYGDVLFELGQRDLALEAWQRAVTLAPRGGVWRVRNDIAREFRAAGESGPEAEELRASLAEEPGQEDARGYLIAAYLALGRYDSAAGEADSALARGGKPEVFGRLRALADSAARAGAPPGSIRIRINTGAGPGR
jgi:protein O-mannosyl-transferase